MNAKHTPGPWKFEDEYVRAPGGDAVADPYCQATAEWGEEMEANARLISAAPELLEACKKAVSLIDRGYELDARHSLNAAIAKAEGNS